MATIKTDLGTLIATVYETMSKELPTRSNTDLAALTVLDILVHSRRKLLVRRLLDSTALEPSNDVAEVPDPPTVH